MLPGIGIFGTGPITQLLIPMLSEQQFRIHAIWSERIQDAQLYAQTYKIPVSTDKIDDMLLLKDIDLVFVLCNPGLHAQITVKALGIGKHVVCDKPAGLNQSDALKMVTASEYYPRLISIVNHSFRFLPAFVHMYHTLYETEYLKHAPITLIDIRIVCGNLITGSGGDIYNWKCDDIMGGGILNLFGSHVIDLVTFLTCGKRAQRVHGVLRTFTKSTPSICGIRQISAPDFCTFQMELRGGVLVVATLNSHLSAGVCFQQEVMVCSTEGYLVVRDEKLFGNSTQNGGGEEILHIDQSEEALGRFSPDRTAISSVIRPYVRGLTQMVKALKHAFQPDNEMAGWFKEPVQLAANFQDSLYTHAVLEAIRRSAQNRQWQTVNIMEEINDIETVQNTAVRQTTTITT